MYRVLLERAAEKDLARLSSEIHARVIAAIQALATNPRPPGCRMPCQDFSDYLRCQIGGEAALVIGISDGAGSAALSHLGSQEAVAALLRQATSCERAIADISREDVPTWFASTLAHLKEVADREKIETKDLACTVLVAVLGERHAVFAQIGDGAWIAETNGVFGAVTWPQNGEFANERANR